MRILFLSAFYPPYIVGGWEQLVEDINDGLRTRGHETNVLTSIFGVNKPVRELGVDRILNLETDLYHYKPSDFLAHSLRLRNNLSQTKKVIEIFRPDVVLVHVMWNLSKGVAWLAEQLCPERVVYYVANDWPYAMDLHTAFWLDRAKTSLAAKAKGLLAPLPLEIMRRENRRFSLEFKHVMCVSDAINIDLAKFTRIDPQKMIVVHNGVDEDIFIPNSSKKPRGKDHPFLLLYAGQLVPHKGVHTAIEAMALLAQKPNARNIHLSIVGSGHPDYEDRLRKLVATHHLEDKVSFLGRFPRSEMPALLRKFDALIFPAIWNEPLPRVIEEAMASELPIIGTLTGGTVELLVERETGLTFKPEHPEMLAECIEQLNDNPELCRNLGENGRNKVIHYFGSTRMLDEIESYLEKVVRNAVVIKG